MITKIKQHLDIQNVSIGIIWLFHVSGIIGILYGNSQWFVGATPLNLSLCLFLLLLVSWKTPGFIKIALTSFLVGMIAEILGVNYGYIFGSYEYGEALGWKIYGVPILIGANWTILTVCSAAIASQIYENIIPRIIIGLGLMILLDFVIEPIAPILDFWKFEGGIAPLQNYIGWFLVALPLQALYHYWNVELKHWFAHHLFLLQLLFFVILLLQINTLQKLL
ncbi:carotenoid biosynthesis protein [Flavobacteriaceae bacterium]|nr:carotenoid biosynthesis protein [Flavobacteriaceae bacterium]MDB2457143.1 carotenoid biosynthesis protein [Flavobacteriaceae bacterium]MDB4620472.1 carotenoid biosynthesis protein [Flavobacteriaceae bacterium]MDB4751522.1 carotenoid biosynthesis protein [Flavobacteriaceae bacterium]MDC0960552.1 carotenoid biosynthesis protein [Flavobacteriaceae bacterium]